MWRSNRKCLYLCNYERQYRHSNGKSGLCNDSDLEESATTGNGSIAVMAPILFPVVGGCGIRLPTLFGTGQREGKGKEKRGREGREKGQEWEGGEGMGMGKRGGEMVV